MARPRKADINSDNRREHLIATAARLFLQKGYHGTTMRDVAASINMQPGSPFYHFSSKQELLFAVVTDGLRTCIDRLMAIDPESQSPLDYFRTMVRTYTVDMLDERVVSIPLVVDEWRHLEGEPRQTFLDLRRQHEDLWLSALQRLQAAGLVSKANRLSCRFFLSALTRISTWYDSQGSLTPLQIADELVDWVVSPRT